MTGRCGGWRFLDGQSIFITIGNASGEARQVQAPMDWLMVGERRRLMEAFVRCQKTPDFSSSSTGRR